MLFIFQTHPTQQIVSVSSTEQPSQSQILLQCRSSSGLDLAASALHAKLLPQPTTSNAEKEEIFAVPKVSIHALVLIYRADNQL